MIILLDTTRYVDDNTFSTRRDGLVVRRSDRVCCSAARLPDRWEGPGVCSLRVHGVLLCRGVACRSGGVHTNIVNISGQEDGIGLVEGPGRRVRRVWLGSGGKDRRFGVKYNVIRV